MTTEAQTTATESWLNDPWLEGANIDTAGWTPERKAALAKKQGRRQSIYEHDSEGDLRPEIIRSERDELISLLADPEVKAELARRDPQFAQRYEEGQIEAVVTEFRKANPDYLRTDRNADAVIQGLGRKYLGKHKDWLSNDEVSAELYKLGKFTVDELTAQFKRCFRAGVVDVPKGKTRPLSKHEEADVVSLVRCGDPSNAVVAYLTYAFGGRLPEVDYSSPRDLLRKHPEVARAAAIFVWKTSKPGLDPEQFAEFERDRLSHIAMPTVTLIEQAYEEWMENRPRRSYLFQSTSQPTAPEEHEPQPKIDYDSMPDEQLDWHLAQARAQAIKDRSAAAVQQARRAAEGRL